MIELTRIGFSVALEGRPFVPDAAINLDGHPVFNGEKISLGNHTLRITHLKGEPVEMKFFAWYGPHDFGQIKLKRTRGTLSVKANLSASSITVSGPEFSTTLENCTATNLIVPADVYTVRATYPHWSKSENAMVVGDQICNVKFSPQFGALHLTCNRDGAAYQLQFADGKTLYGGNLPDTVIDLPVGEYQFTASYHNHQLHKSITVEAGKTNEDQPVFVLGTVRLESVPSGANVRDANGAYLGETPLNLPDMPPQRTQFNLSLSEYQSTPVNVEIVADQTNTFRTSLVSLSYLSAMKNARSYMAAGNYAGVVQAAGTALNANPNDADALALQSQANAQLNAERERQNAEGERVAQLKRPREVFDSVCSKYPDAPLFSEHLLKTSKPAKEAKTAIVKSLQAEPMGFQIFYEDSPQPNVYQLSARHEFSLGILGGTVRVVLLVAGQTKDGETQILFKVLEYQAQHTIVAEGLKFRDDKQLIPLHSSRIQMTDILNSQVQEGIRVVTERIQTAIGVH